MCDGLETCGDENKVCSISRNSKALFTSVLSSDTVKHFSFCVKGLERIETLIGDYCTTESFIFPNHQYFGVVNKTELLLPNSTQNCKHMYGEQYVFTSCTNRCRNSSCVLKNTPRYEVCPNQYPDRIGTIANNEYLVFFTKSHGNFFTNNYFVCDNKITCINYSQVCDLIKDCDDGSDESTCTNHFNCSSSGHLLPKTKQCDGRFDCLDMSDECNDRCSKEILEGSFLESVSVIIGGLAVCANVNVMIKNIGTLKCCTTSAALVNKSLIILISFGDFLVGCYLLIIAIHSTLILNQSYCIEQIDWMTSFRCAMIGVLSTVGSQISLFAMAGLSTIRLNGIRKSLRIPGKVNLMESLKAAAGVLLLALISSAIAITPIIGTLEDFFVNGIRFADQLKIFIGTPDKQKVLLVLEAYYGRMKETTLSWKTIRSMARNMFSHDIAHSDYTEGITKLGFYGNDGVCLFKYFVDKDDPQKLFVWAILAVNFVCFLFISVSYILISVVSKNSSKSLTNSQNKRQICKRNHKMNRRITIIIATDFCCWVPIIIICAFHFLEVLNATTWYSLFSMIILPINSVINPFLYDDVLAGILKAQTRSISTMYQSFRAQFSTVQPSLNVIELEQQAVGAGEI